MRAIMISSLLRGLLIFIPVGIWAFLSDRAPLIVFVTNGIAIVPLSSLLTGATEKIAKDAGDGIGALLNITLGNLVELILLSVALKHNRLHVVQASILGSMLVNLLPILGVALCVNGISYDDPVLNLAETQLLSCLLVVSTFVLLIPAALNFTLDESTKSGDARLRMSRASALVVLVIYICYIIYEIRTYALPTPSISLLSQTADIERYPASMSPSISSDISDKSYHATCFASQGNQGQSQDATRDGESHIELEDIGTSISCSTSDNETLDVLRGRKVQGLGDCSSRSSSCDYVACSRDFSLNRKTTSSTRGCKGCNHSAALNSRQSRIRPHLARLRIPPRSGKRVNSVEIDCKVHRRSRCEKTLSVLLLMISSVLMSMCAEFLVGTIDEITRQGHLSESFIGLVLLPIVGNVAEFVTVVTVAHREKMDLAIAVAVGSAVQIALCVTPLTIIASWVMARDLTLSFSLFDAAALIGATVLVNFFLGDASSVSRVSKLKGALMCACYAIIGIGAFLNPNSNT
ncbi:hypothetical protein LZ31DRAFT_503526 [Colletotrichum somersetense]|nr:hypothetical protein LZ31DRAFT_503526 [Colletotrichum somersetense]